LEAHHFPFAPVTLLANVNQLERLPSFIYDIGRNLKTLELRQNRLKGLRLGPLPVLQCLDISGNQLEDLEFMEPLPLLDQLTASVNRLKRIPNLHHCPLISKLLLNDNQISEVDATILFKARKSLKTLDLRNNDIRSVPDALGYLDVTYLGLTGNPFKAPRQAILGQGKSLQLFNLFIITSIRGHEQQRVPFFRE
jgi:Leucine-rich repeat (LRR) protein